jgi:hypothetical protein
MGVLGQNVNEKAQTHTMTNEGLGYQSAGKGTHFLR